MQRVGARQSPQHTRLRCQMRPASVTPLQRLWQAAPRQHGRAVAAGKRIACSHAVYCLHGKRAGVPATASSCALERQTAARAQGHHQALGRWPLRPERPQCLRYSVHAVDTVGAGDAFASGYGAAVLAGHSLADALQWGNACGAYLASQAGVLGALPSAERLRAMLSQPGVPIPALLLLANA
jgi:hypothetical protein